MESSEHLASLAAHMETVTCIETAILNGFNQLDGMRLIQDIDHFYAKYKEAIAKNDPARTDLEQIWLTSLALTAQRLESYRNAAKSDRMLQKGEAIETALPLPPTNATKLMYLMLPAVYRDHVIGDLEETYLKLLEKFDEPYARRWYWAQALRTTALHPLRTAANYLREIIVGVVSNLLGP